ncbi:MAG: SMP-30/gluconolactonase/LRE family protein [Bacteroidales bacterium]|nr:SMP-30/gluconolactonase/LRE family protein [Bacteroidales bacterium]
MKNKIRYGISCSIILGGILFSGCRAKEEVFPVGEFLPESDRFWEVVPRGAVVERIGINFEFTEGPAWHPGGFLVFSDIPGNTIYQWTGKKFLVYRDSSNQANGLLFMTGGDLLACEHGSRSITRYSPSGKLSTLVDSYQGKRLNSPNDLCRSLSGSIYFTDPPWGLAGLNDDPEKEIGFNGVYRWKNGAMTLIDSTLSWPNGIALSPGENYLYVANMEILREHGEEHYDVFWMRYTLNENGDAADRKIFFRATDTTLPGGPDGMTVDSEGNLFVSGPGGILVLDSSGTHLGTLSLPVPATNLCFGPREKELFITARSTVYRVKME